MMGNVGSEFKRKKDMEEFDDQDKRFVLDNGTHM